MKLFNLFHLSVAAMIWLAVWPVQTPADDQIEFLKDVAPILQSRCGECHSGEEKSGGITLQDRKTFFNQADSGERAIVAGDASASELVKRITATDEDLRMPPEGELLTPVEIELISKWIDQGAIWDGTDHPGQEQKVTSSHWSFQPMKHPEPPSVTDAAWPLNAIDRFIQHDRETSGFVPVPAADAVTLVRRATYGLTGLPPTPEEVSTFLVNVETQGSEHAFANLVDELLARSSYGERWGRHWMDWVRYADTAGDNSDFPIPQAYLYRNYIIESLNSDLRYDRFLTEQIAGDLLPAETQEERNRLNIATGYLAMARRFGSLVERYPWHLTIEDTIDNIGRTTLGLTLSCARCHDHKFDPISTRDYYGLYGIFASTRYPFPGIELFQTQRDLVPLIPASEVASAMQPYQAETDKLTNELNKLLAECQQQSVENAAREPQATIAEQRKMRDELDAMLMKARRAGERLADHYKKIPPIPTAYAVQEDKPHDAKIQLKGEPDRPGASVPRRFPEILGGQALSPEEASQTSGRLQLAHWIADPNNPLTARVIVNRVWQRHFGAGLVPSTSDFGLRGEEPTHPELLDWLATDFIQHGWSLKHLHRQIMNSRTYQLSSQDRSQNLANDPGNRYYWKFNRHRLDAESIRDTLLFISGDLDPTPQTEPYPIPPSAKWEYTQHHPYKDDYPSNKRSVYLMTKRLTAQPYFQTFDGPDPNVCTSNRDESVTSLQALYFVNDEFLHDQANTIATALSKSSDSDQQRMQHAFSKIICREPTPQEQDFMLQHVAAVRRKLADDPQAEEQAWASLIRSLLRLNEFLYID